MFFLPEKHLPDRQYQSHHHYYDSHSMPLVIYLPMFVYSVNHLLCARQFDFGLCFGLNDVWCLRQFDWILAVMYSGIVHVNHIKDGLCFLKSDVNCIVVFWHHLHQAGD